MAIDFDVSGMRSSKHNLNVKKLILIVCTEKCKVTFGFKYS